MSEIIYNIEDVAEPKVLLDARIKCMSMAVGLIQSGYRVNERIEPNPIIVYNELWSKISEVRTKNPNFG